MGAAEVIDKMAHVLILGGARSGKSRFAQELASRLGDEVLFVATGSPLDEEMRVRIEEHKKRRPDKWRTLELSWDVGESIGRSLERVVILDCITLLINNVIFKSEDDDGDVQGRVKREIEELIDHTDGLKTLIMVSNEVGMGIVPLSKLGRDYRDLLG